MIIDSLARVRECINSSCLSCGRSPEDVLLIAVSKTQSMESIKEALNCGQVHFGENKAQELRDKFAALGDKPVWHFIGSLQTNKVKYVVDSATFVHSIDSLNLLNEIGKQSEKKGKHLKCLIEVKTSFEETKAGVVDKEKVFEMAEAFRQYPLLELCGLMTIAPFVDDKKIVRDSFRKLAKMQDELKGSGYSVPHLSMGMTDDFEAAIEEGATMIRIGSAIFGKRNYNN